MTSPEHPTRRAAIGSMIGAAAFAMRPHAASAQTARPPSFATVRHQFTFLRGAEPVPPVKIPRLGGAAINLASLRGKVVLVNFWATWCPACKTELPILDRLAGSGDARIAVIAISVDQGGFAAIGPFVRALKLRHLTIGIDPGGLVSRAGDSDRNATPFALYGMPMSYLIGAGGKVEGYIAGEADWMSADARRLIDYYAASGRV